MKTWVLLTTALFLWVSGCVTHYYKIQQNTVTFYLELQAAQRVYFAHSIDNYRLHMVKKSKSGAWEISVPSDFEFNYFYVVDGAVYLPLCEFKEIDDFGSENCIFVPKP